MSGASSWIKSSKLLLLSSIVHSANAQGGQVGLVFAGGGGAAEGDVPALCQEALKDLHHMPACGRGTGFRPDVSNDQDFGGGVVHEGEILATALAALPLKPALKSQVEGCLPTAHCRD